MLATKYLQWLARYGLDARILQDYKTYGIRYISRRNLNDSADIIKFVDYEGVDRSIIQAANKLEHDLSIEIYHVIWNSSSEIIFMYVDETLDELDKDYQLYELKTGEVDSIRYNIRKNKWEYYTLHPEVEYGAIIDSDYANYIDIDF